MESPDSKVAGLYETTCLLGYGMLPLLLHALVCLLVPRCGMSCPMPIKALYILLLGVLLSAMSSHLRAPKAIGIPTRERQQHPGWQS